ncbi:PREDICTED: uncharacterized protein LOC107167976 [Diuraphis noxia]|uniref:uncharacterized protein LOC107167976 n=1 Tax=Diuraphis noxia TaxID=143948 RepID=UPI0007638316|nr:PREDICTED: uncharacterized protein LOC107167976 [Diuraphis noxia]
MKAWVLIFIIFFFFSILSKNSCQVPTDPRTDSLSPIIILPSKSGISYESLHYPVPADQQYQAIPLVINTGKIPLINHAIQAPIQYFVPNSENRRALIYDSAKYSKARNERPQLRSPETSILYSNDEQQTENRPTYDGNNNNYPSTATATVYSETRIDGLPESRRYSYGYKIIDGHVGDSNDRHDAPIIVGSDGLANYNNLSEPHETDIVFKGTIDLSTELQGAAITRKSDGSNDRRNDRPDNISRALKPVVVKTELNTTKTELEKYYKNVTNPERQKLRSK